MGQHGSPVTRVSPPRAQTLHECQCMLNSHRVGQETRVGGESCRDTSPGLPTQQRRRLAVRCTSRCPLGTSELEGSSAKIEFLPIDSWSSPIALSGRRYPPSFCYSCRYLSPRTSYLQFMSSMEPARMKIQDAHMSWHSAHRAPPPLLLSPRCFECRAGCH